MGSQEILDSSEVMDVGVGRCNGGLLQHLSNKVEENDNLDVDILNDLDVYSEAIINDRLTVSRVVNDSIIMGIVSAVQQEASDEIANRDLELARLKETFPPRRLRIDDSEGSGDSAMFEELKADLYPSTSDASAEFDNSQECLEKLALDAKEQFKKLKIEIDKVKGSCSMRRISSASESLGLSGILSEKVPDKWDNVDKSLHDLKIAVNSICKRAIDTADQSKSVLFQWQQERDFQQEIEGMVMKNCVCGLQEEFELRLWNKSAESFSYNAANLPEGKIKEISTLRQELDAISRLLTVPENGQLVSHGSLEHRKVSCNHISSTNSLWEANGKQAESIIPTPENFDHSQLKHLSRDDLANYYKTEVIKMRRQHESKVQEMTEELFSLKREYLRERSSSSPLKKDKEFEELRRRISGVTSLLDGLIMENDKLPPHGDVGESLECLKHRLESLSLENRQLRGSLADKKKETKFLSSQVSAAAKRLSEASLMEANLRRFINNLRWAAEDARFEASLSDDLYKFLIKEMIGQNESSFEQLELEIDIRKGIYDMICNEAAENYHSISKCQAEDSDLEAIIVQGLSEIIYRGAFQEAEMELYELNHKYVNESEVRAALEMKALEIEERLRLNVAEKEILQKQIVALETSNEEKEKLLQEMVDALKTESQRYAVVLDEVEMLKAHASEQQLLLSQSRSEAEVIRGHLGEAFEKIKMYNKESCELRQSLELLGKEKQHALSEFEAKERELANQMGLAVVLIHGLSASVSAFQCRTEEIISKNRFRLENMSSQISALRRKAKRLEQMGFLYKEALKRKRSDLGKAEAEVDLLGDEVDTLLGLLEKIYIALDHYSPILKHYPGIIEILKLVRRELSGEHTKHA
ncbi:unnamed protein product [Linum tenue]|uniref:WPP domain-associated protein n=1 Tax=Linum tenue TaxID=586396 RepID=A0AAV0QJ14_9ROSI|nr:unnamed protein product [Linum tenue]